MCGEGIDLEKGCEEGKADEETKIASTYDKAMERESYSGGEEKALYGAIRNR